MKMKTRAALFVTATAVLLGGCEPAGDKVVKAKQPAKVTTRWKYDPRSAVATPKGVIIEQTGNEVQTKFVYLKDGPGFVVDRTISVGKYFPDKGKLVFPPGPMLPEQLDQWLRMDAQRVEVAFTPEAPVLKGRWLGKGGPEFDMEFVRVQ